MTELTLERLFQGEIDGDELARQRRGRLVHEMQEAGVDVLVVVDPVNVEYTTGCSRPGNSGVGGAVSATGEVFTSPLPEGAHAPEIWAKAVGALAQQVGLPTGGRVGVDLAPPEHLHSLSELLDRSRAKLSGESTSVLLRAQLVKTPAELECLRRSQRIIGLAMDAARRAIAPGVTPEDLDAVVDDIYSQVDSTGEVVTVAPEPDPTAKTTWHVLSALAVSGEPTYPIPFRLSRPFRSGDVVWIDASVRYHGYCSDYGRTWTVGQSGEPDVRQRDRFKEWMDVRDRIVDVLRPGTKLAELDRVARGSGTGQPWLRHVFYGHGLGLSVPELPLLGIDPDYRSRWLEANGIGGGSVRAMSAQKALAQRGRDFELTPGFVVVLEPVVWDADGGYRAEETYVITDDEPEQISDWSYAPFNKET